VRSSGHASQKNSLVHSMAFCLDGSASGRTLLYKASCASFRVAGVGVPAIRKNAPGCVFLCSGGAFQKNVALRNRMHGRETGGTRRTGPGRRTASILSCIYDAYMARQEHFLLSGRKSRNEPVFCEQEKHKRPVWACSDAAAFEVPFHAARGAFCSMRAAVSSSFDESVNLVGGKCFPHIGEK